MVNTCRCLLISSHKWQKMTVQQQQTTIDQVILSFKFAYSHFRSNWRCKTFWNDSSWSFFLGRGLKRADISTVREDLLVTMYRKSPDFPVLKFIEKWISLFVTLKILSSEGTMTSQVCWTTPFVLNTMRMERSCSTSWSPMERASPSHRTRRRSMSVFMSTGVSSVVSRRSFLPCRRASMRSSPNTCWRLLMKRSLR